MRGPEIIARTISVPRPTGTAKRVLQYHPQSDYHSKVCCWAIMFDLLRCSDLLQRHAEEGRVSFAINRKMNNWNTGQTKNLDLVVARAPKEELDTKQKAVSLVEVAAKLKLQLSDADVMELRTLPASPLGVSGSSVLIALEAKAAMTEHSKAQARLFAELAASHSVIHGDSHNALAVGFAMVNSAERFISPEKQDGSVLDYNRHKQPADTVGVIEKLKELPRRPGPLSNHPGFDAFGILVVDLVNDSNSPMTIVTGPPAPPPENDFNYDRMITRTVHLYDSNFGHI